ncbi:O-antigen ligase-like membrane protein [Mucilaginibacter oryzae]|uniref:O-antigen ligase-like membrane protein n=1 Tax=Mucilaginibacter oryzae TaxID=468058 RepID=A0A316HHJ2_9SPHI|nr:O-antigen ligase family protein [Mucilaginibacter oryzae]PWK77725.1 O-antigen ligase-like membrane protein [Mucilaginibacter oryzae]
MISILVSVFCLILLWKVSVNTGIDQVYWVLLFILFVPPNIVILFFIPYNQFLILILLAGIVFNKDWLEALRSFPLKRTFILFAICMITIALFDHRGTLTSVQKIAKAVSFLTSNILFCLFTYIALNKTYSYSNLYRKIFLILGVFTVYGVVCFVTKANPYATALAEAYNIQDYMKTYLLNADGRTRVNSFSFHPYLYGIILTIATLFFIYYYQHPRGLLKIPKNIALALLALFVVNIFLSNSRSILLIFILAYGLYSLFSITADRFLIYLLIFPIVLLVAFQIPKVSKTIDQLTDVVFNGGNTTEGSNVDMRQQQLLISAKYFNDSPIFGNGFDYIIENLGFNADISKRESDADAFGFESYFFVLLIEQGTIGIIGNLILFIGLIIYHVRNIFRVSGLDRRFVFVNLLTILGYLAFILTTGTLNSMPFFFIMIGVSISIQQKMLTYKKAVIKDDMVNVS